MLPAWADVLILCALPVILGIVLAIWGADEPDNTVIHHQEDEKRDGGSDPDGEPPDVPDDVLIAA